METYNLLLSSDPKLISEVQKTYSGSKKSRFKMVETIIKADLFNSNKIDIPEDGDNNQNREILDVYLKSLGLQLERE